GPALGGRPHRLQPWCHRCLRRWSAWGQSPSHSGMDPDTSRRVFARDLTKGVNHSIKPGQEGSHALPPENRVPPSVSPEVICPDAPSCTWSSRSGEPSPEASASLRLCSRLRSRTPQVLLTASAS